MSEFGETLARAFLELQNENPDDKVYDSNDKSFRKWKLVLDNTVKPNIVLAAAIVQVCYFNNISVQALIEDIIGQQLPINTDWPLRNDDNGDKEYFYDSDSEADADALKSVGWGTSEDYGDYGDDSRL